MADGTGRRPKTHIEGDVERAARHRRAQSNTPIEIDPEDTPPPREPPDPSLLEGFDALAPELQRQLLHLWNTQREQDLGLVKLWEARHVKDDVVALRETIVAFNARLDRVSAIQTQVTQVSAGMVELVAWKNARTKLDDKLEVTLDGLGRRLSAVETNDIKHEASVTLLARDVTAQAGHTTKAIDELRAANLALEGRVRSLEDDRIKYKAKAATVATIASAIVALVAWLIGRFAK